MSEMTAHEVRLMIAEIGKRLHCADCQTLHIADKCSPCLAQCAAVELRDQMDIVNACECAQVEAENAALRKRVEELEGERGDLQDYVERLQGDVWAGLTDAQKDERIKDAIK